MKNINQKNYIAVHRLILIVALLGVLHKIEAQQSIIYGNVSIFNSQFETGKRQFIVNATVEEDFGRSPAIITDAEGNFRLILVGVKEGEKVSISINKNGYEVVNSESLNVIAGQKESVKIFMAPLGKVNENKRKYYSIGRKSSEKAIEVKISRLIMEIKVSENAQSSLNKYIEILSKDSTGYVSEIIRLKKEIYNERANLDKLKAQYSSLASQFEKTDDVSRELAERFSLQNLDESSDIYQKSFRKFIEGKLDSAILILDEFDWKTRVNEIIIEEAKLANLKQILHLKDSIMNNKRINNLIESLMLKGNLSLITNKLDAAIETYTQILRIDSLNIDAYQNLFELSFKFKKIKDQKKLLEKIQTIPSILESAFGKFWSARYHDQGGSNIFALREYKTALEIFREKNDTTNIINVLKYIAPLCTKMELFDKAIDYYRELLEFIIISPIEKIYSIEILTRIGELYAQKKDFDKSQIAYEHTIDLLQNFPDSLENNISLAFKANLLLNLGRLFYSQKKTDKIIIYLREAKLIYEELIKTEHFNLSYKEKLGELNQLQGLTFLQTGDMSNAKQSFEIAHALFSDLKDINPDYYNFIWAENVIIYYQAKKSEPNELLSAKQLSESQTKLQLNEAIEILKKQEGDIKSFELLRIANNLKE